MRKRDIHPPQDDPDRTDALPQFDPAAYEAHLKAMDAGAVDNTDTWLAPQPHDLHAARIDQLEDELKDREAELHALQGTLEVTASSKSRLDGELNGVLDRIAQLESRLDDANIANGSLATLSQALTEERDSLKARCLKADADLTGLSDEHQTQRSRIAELEQLLAAERRITESRLAEIELRATEHSTTAVLALSDADTLRLQLEQTLIELAAKRASTTALESLVAEQTGAAAAIAQRFAEQYSLSNQLQAALDTSRAAMARLEQALALRERSVAALEAVAEEAAANITRLGKDVAGRDESLAALKNSLQAGGSRIVELHDQIGSQQATIAVLNTEKQILQQSLGLREQSLLESSRLYEQSVAVASALAQQLEQLRDDLNLKTTAHEETRAELVESTTSLAVAASERDATLQQATALQTKLDELQSEHSDAAKAGTRQSEKIETLEHRLADFESHLALQGNELQARNERMQALETEAEDLRTRSATLARELEGAQAQSQSLSTELHAREAAVIALRAELATHVDALASIRRDINSIENGQGTDTAHVPLRHLIGVDNADVVHVLNRKVMTIGRTHENDLQIRSSHISRHHARLLIGGSAVIIEDLGSTNGCYVNGRRVRKQVLQNEDVLTIGKTRYRFTARALGDPVPH